MLCVSITTDSQISIRNGNYIIITCNCIDNDYEFISYLHSCLKNSYSYSSENLKNDFKAVINELENKIAACTCDIAYNIFNAVYFLWIETCCPQFKFSSQVIYKQPVYHYLKQEKKIEEFLVILSACGKAEKF